MNTEELKQYVKTVIDSSDNARVFLILGDGENSTIKSADIEDGETSKGIKHIFSTTLKHVVIENEEMSVVNLSISDQRKDAIYKYDYSKYPEKLHFIKDFNIHEAHTLPNFSFNSDSLANLKGFLIYLGTMDQGLLIYKKHYPISLIKRGTFLLIKKAERLVKLDGDDILRLNGDFQIMQIKDNTYISKLDILEKHFGFTEMIMEQFDEVIGKINTKNLMNEIQVLKDFKTDTSLAKKLAKANNNSFILNNNIDSSEIIKFSKTHSGLIGKFKYSHDNLKIILDTKASKIAFIKLLNDDFLQSELTKQSYDSLAKDRLTHKIPHKLSNISNNSI